MSRPAYPRSRRLNAVIREVLAEAIEQLKDPRLGMVSVTGVELSPDQRRALVFFSALDNEHLEEVRNGLRAASGRLRSEVGRRVRMKYTPTLEFRPDSGVIEGERIDAILRELDREHG
jgi:ribosome-binding factor A